MRKLVLTAVPLLLFSSTGAAHYDDTPKPPQITVTGRAVVELPVDLVRITASIVSRDKDAATAQQANSGHATQIRDFFLGAGIQAADYTAGHISLTPTYRMRRDGRREVVGYVASQHIEAVLRDPSRYGDLVAGAVGLGLNRIWDVSFERSDIVERRKEVRVRAIVAAHEKATYLAEAIGQSIGSAIEVEELAQQAATASFGGETMANTYIAIGDGAEERPDDNSPAFPQESIMVKAAVRVVFELNAGDTGPAN